MHPSKRSMSPIWIMLGVLLGGFAIALFIHPGNKENNILKFLNVFGTKNKGELLQPLVDLNNLEANTLNNTNWHWKGVKGQSTLWYLLTPAFTLCDQACEQRLFLIKQIHKRLDKYASRVKKVALSDNIELPSRKPISQYYPTVEWLILPREHFTQVFQTPTLAKHKTILNNIYVIDPRGYAILSYNDKHTANDIFDDLKFLLTNSP